MIFPQTDPFKLLWVSVMVIILSATDVKNNFTLFIFLKPDFDE